MNRLIILVVLAFATFAGLTASASRFESWEELCSAASENLQEGDLIFIDRPYYLFRKVAEATNSWTSHVGIVFKDEEGQWIVSESRLPLSSTRPLCDYLRDSSEYRSEVRRLNQALTEEDIAKLKKASNALMGQLYHLGFDYDSDRLFCSKFVFDVFSDIGIEVGKLQSFGELLEEDADNPTVGFWKFWFFGSIPENRRTLTPASQLRDPKFHTVFESY